MLSDNKCKNESIYIIIIGKKSHFIYLFNFKNWNNKCIQASVGGYL